MQAHTHGARLHEELPHKLLCHLHDGHISRQAGCLHSVPAVECQDLSLRYQTILPFQRNERLTCGSRLPT